MDIISLIGLGVVGVLAYLSHRYMKSPPHPLDELDPPVSPILPPSEPLPVKPKDMPTKQQKLDILCTAIRDFEGKPGDQNYRFNNPGNFRYSPVGYLPKYGNVKKSPNNFAIFPTYELGWEYMQASIMHWVQLHPQWTFKDLIYHYAPPSDDNPTQAYALNIAKKCGVTINTKLTDYLV